MTDARGLPRLRPADADASPAEQARVERARAYSIQRWSGQLDAAAQRVTLVDTEYEVPGDHIHVLELIGSDSLAIATRQRDRTYDFIPVREGDTIRREFDMFTVRNLSIPDITGIFPVGEAKFLVSHGEVLTRLPRPHEFGAGMASATGVATPGGVDLFDNAFSGAGSGTPHASYIPPGLRASFLKYGGTLRVKNKDLASPLYIGWGAVGNGFQALNTWEIDPGAIDELEVPGRMSFAKHSISSVANAFLTLCAYCDAGTITYKVLVSNMGFDGSDEESGTSYRRGLTP